MRRIARFLLLPVAGITATAAGQQTSPPLPDLTAPVTLNLQQQEPNVYALPAPAAEKEGANTGGVNIDMKVTYLSDYIYRGLNIPDYIGDVTGSGSSGHSNFQFDGKLTFDLGKLPHPFIGIFTNVLDSDPVTNFEEVLPFFGAEWRIRPVILSAGINTYLFPDRSDLNTSEVWGQIMLDDKAILHRDEPLVSPYILAAYDYDLYNGWYLEAGVSHDFAIENTPIVLTALADVAYVLGQGQYAGPTGQDSGFQHYRLGLEGRYNLNTLLNIPQRLGKWSLNGYIYYVDGIDNDLRSFTGLWGGGGIEFRY